MTSVAHASTGAIGVKHDFPSGSIGEITQVSNTKLVLALKDDNDDASLPAKFRNWWYVKLENIPINQSITIDIEHLGWHEFYVPVYSYDQQHWFRFDETEVSQSKACEAGARNCVLSLSHPFKQDNVFIARFYPYPLERLQAYVAEIQASPYLKRETLGNSSVLQLPIEMLTVTDFAMTDQDKTRVWLQARTHPGETGSSFVLEGLLNFLLSDDEAAKAIRQQFIFNIVPMHNPDGVQAGNYRTTLTGVELERAWGFDPNNPATLLAAAPKENRVLNEKMRQWLQPGGHSPPISVAINMHSTVTQANVPAFFFNHFGANPHRYTAQEQSLHHQQVTLIEQVQGYYQQLQAGLIQDPLAEGGMSFLDEHFPETWWWANRKDHVLAVTLETVYGKAGFDHWVSEDDIRQLGNALGRAIGTLTVNI